ncbi:MAG: TSUP family transporter [Candidatus Cloacimonetes bacterium]|nr:TSUP family transporter [Candidatus Cloacimonadota bacterium]MDY0230467.1 TSUP family transporter [Candidatus Cloacimonadaceae bacterium]
MPISLSVIDYLIILPFIFLAGFIDAIAGGGGLISLPAYWSAGIPPHMALGTNKFSSCSGTIFSTARFLHARMIDVPVALIGAVMALAGSWLGASTALLISGEFLNYLLIVLIPLITVLVLVRKNLGFSDTAHLLKLGYRLILGALAGLIIGFYDGFFGPGTGTFLILIYSVLLHYDFVRANGNSKVVNLASNMAAVVTFAVHGQIWYPIAIPAAVCGIAGNLLGSKMVMLRGNKIIRKVFILALVLLLIRVLYNVFL